MKLKTFISSLGLIFLILSSCSTKKLTEIYVNRQKNAIKQQAIDEFLKNQKPGIIGIGGVFFKSSNPDSLKKWYFDKLGLKSDKYGTNFEWRKLTDDSPGFTTWSVFHARSRYFNPSPKDFMINYRVYKLDEYLIELKSKGVVVFDSVQTFEYGRFAWIMDMDSNKLELWEPVDNSYDTIIGSTRIIAR